MYLRLTAFIIATLSFASASLAQVYELRTYTTNEGKLDALHARFRDHTVKLFEKHGMKNIGYWVPTDPERSKDTLIYVIEHQSKDAAQKSWGAFIADPDWQAAYKASTADGKLVSKVDSVFMEATDYSPKYESSDSDKDAVFELRIYKTNEGKLDGLNARFRDHTMRLFEKHGIQNVAYWTPIEAPDSSNTLIYIIRHRSTDAAKDSWKAFGSDKEWQKVAEESQKDGKFLSERPSSTYMTSTDYSLIK